MDGRYCVCRHLIVPSSRSQSFGAEPDHALHTGRVCMAADSNAPPADLFNIWRQDYMVSPAAAAKDEVRVFRLAYRRARSQC